MGRKCFVPHCKTGYNTCHDKLSLFSAPKDDERRSAWQRAISRTDRLLQVTDYVCEKHFEPRFVVKTWTAQYKGRILASCPRRPGLLADAVPSIFPECTCSRSGTPKKKRPAKCQRAAASKRSTVTRVENNSPETLNNEPCSSAPSTPIGDEYMSIVEIHEVSSDSFPAANFQLFASLFDDLPLSCLPSKSWGYHKLEAGEVQSVVFSQLARVDASSRNNGSELLPSPCSQTTMESRLQEALRTGSTCLVTPRLVEIDQSMHVSVMLMGRPASVKELPHADPISTIEDVREFLQNVDNLKLCAGGPSIVDYPQAKPSNAVVDIYYRWRHIECVLILPTGSPVCKKCLSLSDTLQTRPKRASVRKLVR